MKKEIAFIVFMIAFGIVLGPAIVAILAAVAMPGSSGLIMTPGEKADFEGLSRISNWVNKSGGMTIIMVVGIALLIAGSILLLINLNPNFTNKLKGKTARLKLVVVFLGILTCLFLLTLIPIGSLSHLFSYLSLPLSPNYTAIFILYFFFTGFLWLIAGEMGWAGDFSSWEMGVQGKEPKPLASFILGGVAGSVAFGFYYLNNWAFNKYFILAITVLGKTAANKSGEFTFRVFRLAMYELMFMLSMSLVIFAGIVTALSPTYRELRQRLLRLIFPAILIVILGVTTGLIYHNAAVKYDLGRKNFAEALGVPDKAPITRTVVSFRPDKALLQEWPIQVSSSTGWYTTSTVELSYDNLKKIEDYLEKHKDGSVFAFDAREMLTKGYHTLWDMQKGIEQQFKNSEYILIQRLQLLSRLRYLPVTPENLNYLKAFTDEGKWYAGSRSALTIAEGFMHFGITEEANKWVQKAKERGADISKVTFLNEPVLKDGKVLGVLKVNGKSPANTRVALLRYSENVEKIEDYSLPHRLLDVRLLDPSGRFAFDHLGKGEYLLAIMTDKEIIPYNLSAEKLKVTNSPGVIKLDSKTPNRNLGDINVSVTK